MAVPGFVAAIGPANSSNQCTPGAELWVTPGAAGALSQWHYAGTCPEAATVVCAQATLPSGGTIYSWINNSWGPPYANGSTCFEDARLLGGGGGGATGGGGASAGGGFDLTEAQQAEVYAAASSVLGAVMAAMVAIWGLKRILALFGAR